jgi:hypothetical protein
MKWFLIPYHLPHGRRSQHLKHSSVQAVIQAKADQQLTAAMRILGAIAN